MNPSSRGVFYLADSLAHVQLKSAWVGSPLIMLHNNSMRPLCVDLDGTIIRADLSLELLGALFRRAPLKAIYSLVLLAKSGRPAFKEYIAQNAELDLTLVPENHEVLDFIRAERLRGRTLVLISGSPQLVVRRIADHLKIFDEVVGSSNGVNLISKKKAEYLESKYGAAGFDYLGNSNADFAVWEKSNTVISVQPSDSWRQKVQTQFPKAEFISIRPFRAGAVFKSLRVEHWAKNLLIFVPQVASHRLSESTLTMMNGLTFLCLSMVASFGYLWNDFLDVENDRRSPTKKKRPLAAGDVEMIPIGLMALLLLFAAASIAAFLPLEVRVGVLAYLGFTMIYSTFLKRISVVDVVWLAWLYVFRIYLGGVATGIHISQWLWTFVLFFALNLAFLKRVVELIPQLRAQGGSLMPGRGYSADDLIPVTAFGVGSSMISVLVLALYVSMAETAQLYAHPLRLWLIIPIVLLFNIRTWMKGFRGEVSSDIIHFVLRDRTSLALLALLFCVVAWAWA